MADPVVDEVLALLGDDRNLGRLVDVLCGLNDKQRRALSGPIGRHADAVWIKRRGQNVAGVAVLGCVTGVRKVGSLMEWISLDADGEAAAVEVLRARAPDWLPALPEALLVGRERSPYSVRVLWGLVRAGLLPRPALAEYRLAMVDGLVGRLPGEASVATHLEADPWLLEHQLWDMLATEGVGKAMYWSDYWIEAAKKTGGPTREQLARSWRLALLDLTARGVVDRQRLLDATLSACVRDWTTGDVAWFVRLHDELAPTVDELVARQPVYARLLTVSLAGPVNLGLRVLRAMLDAARLDPDLVLGSAAPALTRPEKGPAVAGLKLLEALAAADPGRRPQIAAVVAHALGHERVDVQERALKLLAKLVPDVPTREALVRARADDLAPSLQPLAGPSTTLDDASASEPVHEAPAPQRVAALEPVADADELASLFARLIEEADDPAEVERLLEGVVRLAGTPPTMGAEALAQRLEELWPPYAQACWSGEELRADLVRLGLVWLGELDPGDGHRGRFEERLFPRDRYRPDWSLRALVTSRVHEVAVAVARRRPAVSLSFPSRRDGTLDAAVLHERLAASTDDTRLGPLDVGLALLRVAPTEWTHLRLPPDAPAGMHEELDLLVGHVPEWAPQVGEVRGRYRTDVFPRSVTWQDRSARKGRVDRPVAAVLDRSDPLDTLGAEIYDGEFVGRFEQVTAMWPLMLPHHVDLLAAHAHGRLVRGLSRNRNGTEPLISAIGASSSAIGAPALSALVLGLAARNGGERTVAVDAVIDLAARGAIDGRLLGSVLGHHLAADAVVGSRVVTGLTEAATASASAATIVGECLSSALPALAGRRDAHLFVDLLAQAAIRLGQTVVLPEPFLGLATGRKTSQLALACRRIPLAM